MWLLKLRELYKLPVSTVEDILQDVQNLLTVILSNLHNQLKSQSGITDEFLLHCFHSYTDIFVNLKSDYNQKKYFREHFGFVVSDLLFFYSNWSS